MKFSKRCLFIILNVIININFKYKKGWLKTDYCDVAFIVDGREVGRTPYENFTGGILSELNILYFI